MSLRQEGQFNDLSPKLRTELSEKVRGFGKTVRYKFDVSNENPDPAKTNGKVIWPNVYVLDPALFYITDPYETRETKSKSKRIGLIMEVDDKGVPNKFKKIKVDGKYAGILKLEIEEIDEHFEYAMYLEMHPKLTNGKFSDRSKRQIFTRIDEQAAAKQQRADRSERLKALNVAQSMSDKELIDFADAMLWDSSQDIDILKNQIEELADTNFSFFNDLVEGKRVEYQSSTQQALNKNNISFDPAAYDFLWSSNRQIIVKLSPVEGKNHIELMAEWLQTGGSKAEEVYKRIRALNNPEKS